MMSSSRRNHAHNLGRLLSNKSNSSQEEDTTDYPVPTGVVRLLHTQDPTKFQEGEVSTCGCCTLRIPPSFRKARSGSLFTCCSATL